MKKLGLTIAIILGIGICTFAQHGFFQHGPVSDEEYYGAGYYDRTVNNPTCPLLPNHGQTDNQQAPLGCGVLLLISLGAAYALKKRNKK